MEEVKKNKNWFRATICAFCVLCGMKVITAIGQAQSMELPTDSLSNSIFKACRENIIEGNANLEELETWSRIALEEGLFEEWMALKNSLIDRPMPIHACSRHVQLLFGSRDAYDKDLSSIRIGHWSKDSLTWYLAKYAFGEWQLLNASHTILPLDFDVPSATEDPLRFWKVAALFGLLLLSGLLLLNRKWLFQLHNTADHELIRRMENMIQQKQKSSTFAMSVAELDLLIQQEAIGRKVKKGTVWHGLTKKQQLILYLSLENFIVDDIAAYLRVSKGYIYNQRSELRQRFQLQDQESFQSIWD